MTADESNLAVAARDDAVPRCARSRVARGTSATRSIPSRGCRIAPLTACAFRGRGIVLREFEGDSLTPRQKAALVIVYQSPGLNQNALADRLFMDRNTVAEMVKRLAAGGLLHRTSAQADQRAYELFLAPAGAQLLNKVMPRDALVEARVLERLPEEYRALFVKCLRLLAAPLPDRQSGSSP